VWLLPAVSGRSLSLRLPGGGAGLMGRSICEELLADCALLVRVGYEGRAVGGAEPPLGPIEDGLDLALPEEPSVRRSASVEGLRGGPR
jgi:hypothetical protein